MTFHEVGDSGNHEDPLVSSPDVHLGRIGTEWDGIGGGFLKAASFQQGPATSRD